MGSCDEIRHEALSESEWPPAHGEFASDEVLLSEMVTIHFYTWQIGLQILVKYSLGRKAVLLQRILRNLSFLFMSFVGFVCLTQKFLSTCETAAGYRHSQRSRSRVLP